MIKTDTIKRINELTELLNRAARAYYNGGATIMEDREYDALYDELAALERSAGYAADDSPTKRVGYETVSELTKVRHRVKMLSLDKTKETARLAAFLSGVDGGGLLSWKLDGLTVVLTYKDGALFQAVTRGNGEVGEDVTHNAKTFANLPSRVDCGGELTIRGEAVISYADFDRANESAEDGERYKNPRNLCAGSVRQLDSSVCKSRNVRFVAFAVVDCSEPLPSLRSARLDWLDGLGFETAGRVVVTAENVEAAAARFTDDAPNNPYPADGLVLMYDDAALGESLGSTAKFPRDAIAFKWADDVYETTLEDVEWNTSRTGLINPVAVFKPVELEGTTVTRASVHNVSVLKSLQLGIGDAITVYKANMIIPQIADNLTRSDSLAIPDRCPVCGGEAAVTLNNETESLYCLNPACSAKTVEAIAHFVSRDAMNIEGLAVKTIEKFAAMGWLNKWTDIYKLSEHSDEIRELEGFGDKSLANLTESIELSKKREWPNFLNALGIPQVGLSTARLLRRRFDGIQAVIGASNEGILYDELMKIDGFGNITARAMADWFADDGNAADLADALPKLDLTNPALPSEQDGGAVFGGMTFVITGEMNAFANRAEASAYIEARGGKVAGSVSKKTAYLVNNDSASTSGKNKKAAELNVSVITEDKLREMGG